MVMAGERKLSAQAWLQLGKITQKVGQNKKLNKIIFSGRTIPIVVFISFWLLSLGIGGPAYMSDEIGYLSKAATVAGSTVHLSTSWFAGYSLLISPAFLLSSDPYVSWNIIIMLNALMWAGTAALLQYILRRTHPQASERAIFFATLGAMLYPSWLSMSGYAFATSGFVLVFMAALAALLKSNLTNMKWLGLTALLVGYLGWIHPFGLIFVCLFSGVFLLKVIVERSYRLLGAPVLACIVAAAYFVVVHPWFTQVMGGNQGNDNHYSAGFSGLLQLITTLNYWLQAGTLLIGLLFFTMIATFGVVAYSSSSIIRQLLRDRQYWRKILQKPESLVMAMTVVVVFGAICFTALSWGVNPTLRPDQWIYGRYSDMYLLPLIAFGLLAGWRYKQALAVAGFVILTGVLLSLATNPDNTAWAYINKVNLQSFWPIHLPRAVRTNNYWVWGLLGASAIVACGFMGTSKRKIYLPALLVPLIALAGLGNYLYQYRIARGYAAPSSLYQYVQTNFTTTDCIGFTPDLDKSERFNLYSYYLQGYDMKKMTLDEWQRQDCKGPYLTYDSALAVSPELQVIGLEATTGLYMITTLDGPLALHPNQDQMPILSGDNLLGYAVIFK